MFKVVKKEIEVAGKKISLETGKIARQADGAIIAQCGETVVLATAVGAKKVNPDMDYFPLIKPTLEAPTGPIKGIHEIAKADEDAMIDKISASFSLS